MDDSGWTLFTCDWLHWPWPVANSVAIFGCGKYPPHKNLQIISQEFPIWPNPLIISFFSEKRGRGTPWRIECSLENDRTSNSGMLIEWSKLRGTRSRDSWLGLGEMIFNISLMSENHSNPFPRSCPNIRVNTPNETPNHGLVAHFHIIQTMGASSDLGMGWCQIVKSLELYGDFHRGSPQIIHFSRRFHDFPFKTIHLHYPPVMETHRNSSIRTSRSAGQL